MATNINGTANGVSYEITAANSVAGVVLTILFLYLFFRHFLMVLMIGDIVLGWLRKFSWFPGQGKRKKAFLHWIIALLLFVSFLLIARPLGWLVFMPQ